LVLRRYVPVTVRWVFATTIGNVIAWLTIPVFTYAGTLVFLVLLVLYWAAESAGIRVNVSLPPGLARIYFLVPAGLVGAAGGAIVAASQELSLPVPLRPPVRWVRLSAVAGFLAAATAGLDLFGRALGRSIAATGPSLAFPSASTAFPLFPSGLTSGLAFGAIDGITTGFALVRWLREGPGR
jgi:hypothetical protein